MLFFPNNAEQEQFAAQSNAIKEAFNKLDIQGSSEININITNKSILIFLSVPKEDRILRDKLSSFFEKLTSLIGSEFEFDSKFFHSLYKEKFSFPNNPFNYQSLIEAIKATITTSESEQLIQGLYSSPKCNF